MKLTDLPREPKPTLVGAVSVPPFLVSKPVVLSKGWSLDSSDTRLLGALSAPDPSLRVPVAIWTAQTVAGAGRSALVRWFELDPRGPWVLQHGTIADPRRWGFNPAISPTRGGGATVISYDVAGGSMPPVIRVRFRVGRMPRGMMTGQVTLAGSRSSDPGCAEEPRECRWGGYAGGAPDPLRPDVVWGSNELIGPPIPHRDDHWTTQNFAIGAS